MTAVLGGREESEFWLEAPWSWILALRRFAGAQVLATDLVIAVVLDIATAIPLIPHETRWWVWALDQALVLPLAFRRRQPFAVFVLIAGVGLIQWAADVSLTADAALLLALYTVAERETRLRTIAAAATLEVGVVLASVRFQPVDDRVVNSLVFLTAMVVAALFLATTVRARRAYLESVVDRAARLEVERDQEARLAATRERTRIAREMHDIVAHNLSVMIALADGAALTNAQDPGAAAQAMESVSATGRGALAEMRRLLGVLRDDDFRSDLSPQPGLDQLGELTERLRKVGREVVISVTGTPGSLSPSEDASAYRIIQESLTNVVKHATGATRAEVALGWETERLTIDVVDDGRAAPATTTHGRGLDGIAERVAVFGGTVTAGQQESGGWRVRVVLPIGSP
ncbi:MAG: two-component sensor histidine kinase [Frankiaceae bacterium]|nr:two-component sensor histidine kinase [Frankiaceae bacterium]MBV9871229.1 two-component sensor histidine kinase [Frankiaceae bacterium]